MIAGIVNANREATIRFMVLGPQGYQQEIEAIIDTGFTGFLTLPPLLVTTLGFSWLCRQPGMLADGRLEYFDVYVATVIWDGQPRTVEDAVLADGNAKDVRSTRAQGCLATADWLAVNAPVLGPDSLIDERTQAGLGACISDLGAEEDGEGCDVHQEVATGRQPVAVGRESPSGDDVGHVRMGEQRTGPGMEYANHTDTAAEDPGVQSQSLHGL